MVELWIEEMQYRRACNKEGWPVQVVRKWQLSEQDK